MRKVLVSSAFLMVSALALPVSAQQPAGSPQLPESYVDTFRVDTQYGSSKAVLNPVFARDNKIEIGLGGAYSAQSSLMSYYSATGSLTYHINLRHSIEPIWFGYAWGKQGKFVRDEITAKLPAGDSRRATLGVEIPEQMYAASYFFSPYYTKMHITEQSVAHFDVYMGAGFGFVRNRTVYLDDTKGGLTNRPGASVAAGIRFMMPSRWGWRFELRDIIHRTGDFGKVATANTLQVGTSIDIFFGSFKDTSND